MGRKWANIVAKKTAKDGANSKVYAKFGVEIYVAAKKGDPDPESNSALKFVIDRAKQAQVPKHVIDKALDKAKGNTDETFTEGRYEGFGPNGSMLIVDTLTSNVNRTAANVRAAFGKNGGNMGASGSVSYLFDNKGVIVFAGEDADAVFEQLLEADVDVDDVEAVFNYDLPQDDEFYVHRIGRTGRAGRVGKAFTFVTGKEVYKLKEIQRYCKTKIYAPPIPSLNDVTQIKLEKALEQLDGMIQSEDLAPMINVLEKHLNETDYTAMDIAAAFLKQAVGTEDMAEGAPYDFGDTGAEEGMVRLFINIGKKQNIRPGDILGAIAGESGMPGRLVGCIDMYDKYTFVEVPRENARDVLNAMDHAKIKGKLINIEPANPGR